MIDGAAFVHMNPPKLSTNYGDYCEHELGWKVKSLAKSVKRIDVVFDIYKQQSRKKETRQERTKNNGVRISIKKDTQIFQKFPQVMAIDENKTELFTLIADVLKESCNTEEATIVITRLENIVSNRPISTIQLAPCLKEEADDRMFVHVKDLCDAGYRRITIITVDTDVVIIALSAMWDLTIEELWIELGVGRTKRWIPIHILAAKIGEEICRAMLFWYAFTGCDTVSQFQGRGKKTAWKTWDTYPKATETFVRLSSLCPLSASDIEVIERYVILLYDKTSACANVNDCRRQLFTQQGRMIDNCPPTQDALMQHTLRAILQASIWANCLERAEPELDVNDWGWTVDSTGNISPKLTTLPKASQACKELKHCKCKKGKCASSSACTCKRFSLPCTELCACCGSCDE